jgi:hypothetical protein
MQLVWALNESRSVAEKVVQECSSYIIAFDDGGCSVKIYFVNTDPYIRKYTDM